MTEKRGLLQRLNHGGVVCAEGYLFELERRGLLQAGPFVPEVALESPESLAQVHREFMWAGSDIIEAFTYYGHREKLRLIGKEELLEPLNRQALRIAKQVANEAQDEPPLVAGNICNTNIYEPGKEHAAREVRAMFEEMVGWAAEEGADLIIAETFYYLGEARIALDVIKQHDLPAVVTFALMADGVLCDGYTVEQGCRILEDGGADVVGMNCFRGPATMLPHLRKIRETVSGHVAALPVPYRTTEGQPTFFKLTDPSNPVPLPHERLFPTALDPLRCNRYEIAQFAHDAYELGIKYLGVCCGAAPIHIREVAEAIGRVTPASRYSPDMQKHFLYGTDASLNQRVKQEAAKA